jgi:galactokinase
MTGAGFGGCALAVAPADAAEKVTETVTGTFAGRGFREPEVFGAHPADGATRVA